MLEVRSVTKTYGSVTALDDVSATFATGEIHAVLGENGAGKSTLMHIMSGFTKPDSGEVLLDGHLLVSQNPKSEIRNPKSAISMVHQHFTLVPAFTVQENLALAQLTKRGPIDEAQAAQPALDLAHQLGWPLDPNAITGQLPVGVQQRIEIVKSLAGESKVAIFDEPTAVLTPSEVDELFRVLRQLKEQGRIVILIAHKLQEVMAIADRVTVLRRGKTVAESPITASPTHPVTNSESAASPEHRIPNTEHLVTSRQLAEWMVGEFPESLTPNTQHPTPNTQVLQAQHLSAKGDRGEEALRGITFTLHKGEILGFGGVDGNGQVELAEVLAQIRPHQGELTWQGEDNPRIAYIPQDRQTDGLALSMSIEDNLLISQANQGLWLNPAKSKAWADRLIDQFQIKANSSRDKVASLSGGNQQKVVVARSLDQTPDLLIAVNPTRGLDVRATDYVHRQILAARDQGAAVVLISPDLDELAALATRTLFLSRGQIAEGQGAQALVGGIE